MLTEAKDTQGYTFIFLLLAVDAQVNASSSLGSILFWASNSLGPTVHAKRFR